MIATATFLYYWIILFLVTAKVRSRENTTTSEGQYVAFPPGKGEPGWAGLTSLPSAPVAPPRGESPGLGTWKMQCVRLNANITLKDAAAGKHKHAAENKRRKWGRAGTTAHGPLTVFQAPQQGLHRLFFAKKVQLKNSFFRSAWAPELGSLHVTAGAPPEHSRRKTALVSCPPPSPHPPHTKDLGRANWETVRNVFMTTQSLHIPPPLSYLRLRELSENSDAWSMICSPF